MRTLHADGLAALTSGRYRVRCLLKAEPDEGDFCIWDDLGTIVVSGDTYVGRPGRFTVSAAVSEKGATVPKMDATLSGLDQEAVALIEAASWHLRPITVSRAVIALDAPTVLHILPEFSGRIDQMELVEEAGSRGTSTLIVRCESAPREYHRTYARTRSDVDQRLRDSDDAFLEFAADSIVTQRYWGPKQTDQKQKKQKDLIYKLGLR